MKHSVSLLVRNSLGRFLVLQRSQECKSFPGRWEFPGGKIHAGEALTDAACRETEEETGLRVPRADLGSEPVRNLRTPDQSAEYAFFTWRSAVEAPEIRLSREHCAHAWVTFTHARKLGLLVPHREFLEQVWHGEQLMAYEALFPRYQTLSNTLDAVLKRLIREWSPLAIVQARPKSITSFAEKCLRKADKYNDPANELTDLCGGRVVCPVTTEAETICRQIRTLFEPVDEHEDTRRRHTKAEFGYLSVHFIVHFDGQRPEMLGVPIPPEIVGLKAEIQVRTLLQHAHSEITHDRLYKGGFLPPAHFEREAARVAALLEEADDTFGRFVARLDAYLGHHAAYLESGARQRQQDNLRLVIAHERDDAKKAELALRLARLARAAWDWQAVVDAVSSFADIEGLQQADLRMELGNALCRLHRGQSTGAGFKRGVDLLTGVARPDAPRETIVEARLRSRRATALAWLGSALGKVSGRREEAKRCLGLAVELDPDDPYHLTAFVELNVVGCGTDTHLPLLAPSLRQAAGRCEAHVRAEIEVTRAWLTASKIRLFLGETTDAFEALCVASLSAETHHPLIDFQRSLDLLKDAIGEVRPFVHILDQAALVLALAKEGRLSPCPPEPGLPLARRHAFSPGTRVLILAGSTARGSENLMRRFEPELVASLAGFQGALLTGGTDAGVCGLAIRLAAVCNEKQPGAVDLVGYLPDSARPSAAFASIVRTTGNATFSALEPLQMWVDLLVSCVKPTDITVLCLGGGQISSQELALGLALGARTVVVGDDGPAARRFAALLETGGRKCARGIVLPDDPATLAALLAFDRPIDAQQWEQAGMAVHQAFLDERSQHPELSNLVSWPLLRDDFKHSNRHQAACAADILRRSGFEVTRTDLPPDRIPLPEFTIEEVNLMAEKEHGRWNVERLDAGWRYGEKKDEKNRISPYLVPWAKLGENIKGYDREAVRTWPAILARAGLAVTRKA